MLDVSKIVVSRANKLIFYNMIAKTSFSQNVSVKDTGARKDCS